MTTTTETPKRTRRATLTMPDWAFVAALRAVDAFRPPRRDGSRPILETVEVSRDGDAVQFVATDSYCLGVVRWTGAAKWNKWGSGHPAIVDFDVPVLRRALDPLSNAKLRDVTLTLGKPGVARLVQSTGDGDLWRWNGHGAMIDTLGVPPQFAPIAKGEFVNWHRITDKDRPTVLAENLHYNLDLFTRAAKAVRIIAPRDPAPGVTFHAEGPASLLSITAGAGDLTLDAYVMGRSKH